MREIIEVCDETQTDDANINGYVHFKVDDNLAEILALTNEMVDRVTKMYRVILKDFNVNIVSLEIDFEGGVFYYSIEGIDTCIACATWKELNDIPLPCSEPI